MKYAGFFVLFTAFLTQISQGGPLDYIMPQPLPIDGNDVMETLEDIQQACSYVKPALLAQAQRLKDAAAREKENINRDLEAQVEAYKRQAAEYALAYMRWEDVQFHCAARRAPLMPTMYSHPPSNNPAPVAPIFFNAARYQQLFSQQMARLSSVHTAVLQRLVWVAAMEKKHAVWKNRPAAIVIRWPQSAAWWPTVRLRTLTTSRSIRKCVS